MRHSCAADVKSRQGSDEERQGKVFQQRWGCQGCCQECQTMELRSAIGVPIGQTMFNCMVNTQMHTISGICSSCMLSLHWWWFSACLYHDQLCQDTCNSGCRWHTAESATTSLKAILVCPVTLVMSYFFLLPFWLCTSGILLQVVESETFIRRHCFEICYDDGTQVY